MLFFGLISLFATVAGCATYSQDLERARRHYQALEFPRALALLRVLGEDVDALSPAERVQFTYLRGMTDLRLADTFPSRSQQRRQFRACASEWLKKALELEQALPGALSPEQERRTRTAVAQLFDVEAKESCGS